MTDTSTSTGTATVDDVGAIRVLTIDHPEKRNALDDATRRSLRQRLLDVADAPGVRVVVLTGAEETFCAGGELASMPSEVEAIDRRMGELHDIARAIVDGPVPVIAAIEGFAFGSGMSMAAASDHVIASREARFSASFGRVGLVGDVGIARSLVRRVGVGPATELLLWADELSAERAAALGLVDELVEAGSTLDAAMAAARRLADRAPMAVAAARRLVRAADLPLDDFLRAELDEQRTLLGTADFHEGRDAFFAKRARGSRDGDPVTHTFRRMIDPTIAADYRARGFWGDDSLADHVRRLAADRPEATAIVADSGRLAWGAYRDRATQLASELVAAGLSEGDRLAVMLPDGGTVHIVFLAAELAGLTVVGIGARAGLREVRHMVGRTGAVGLVTQATHRGSDAADLVADVRAELAEPTALRHLVVPVYEAGDHDSLVVDGEPVAAVRLLDAAELDVCRLGPDDLFLVNSTSGTTGLPKCVVHTQNRWVYFHRRAVISGALTGDDVFLSAVPAPFGFGLWTAHFTPTLLGAPVVLAERFSPERTLELIERERVTVLGCVSTQFIMMLNSPDLLRRDLSSLRAMFTGGEAIPYTQAREFEERTGCTVLQFFGSNETGLLSGTMLGDPPDRRLRTAGRVVDDMEVRLYVDRERVDAPGRGQPAGRGPTTCLGYLDDPAANAELFTDDGWMLMGDICELDADGWLTVVGRTSDIIIRGGKNISAAQVEEEVATHPSVGVAAALAQADPVFGERVCVYVELVGDTDLSLEDLVEHLAERGVSKELLPERLIVLGELPRSSGGKVAKGDLRRDLDQRTAAASTEPPATARSRP